MPKRKKRGAGALDVVDESLVAQVETDVPVRPVKAGKGEGKRSLALEDELEFEDPFLDEYEDNEDPRDVSWRMRDTDAMDDGDAGEEADEEDDWQDEAEEDEDLAVDPDQVVDADDEMAELAAAVKQRAWLPSMGLDEGDKLEFSNSAYDMLHKMTMEWPCLSFDVLRDDLGWNRTRFPATAYVAAGTQAASNADNRIVLVKASAMHRTRYDSDNEDDPDNDDLEDDAVLEFQAVRHPQGAVNRLRSMPQQPAVLATWADAGNGHGSVCVWNTADALARLEKPTGKARTIQPLHVSTCHQQDGFALDWNPLAAGRFASGDCERFIYVWEPSDGASGWMHSDTPFVGHTESVEDLQWSPSNPALFASCGVDRSICFWDTRRNVQTPVLRVDNAHTDTHDLNVISWNRAEAASFLLASGGDDGSFCVWDIRRAFKEQRGAARFVAQHKWHTAPITSIQWDPNDTSVLAVASADDQVSIWDLSVEADAEAATDADPAVQELPPQLLFIHQGQHDVKELHWHPQMPATIVSTAADGLHFWRPSNLLEAAE